MWECKYTQLYHPLPLGQTIATCQCNISQHCLATLLRHVARCWMLLAPIWKWPNFSYHHFSWCCSRLTRFVQQCCNRVCTLVWLSIPNMSQHATTGWPNSGNMLHPTMLRYVVFNNYCCDRLDGTCKCWANDVGICCVEMLQSFGRGFTVMQECNLTYSTPFPTPSIKKQSHENVTTLAQPLLPLNLQSCENATIIAQFLPPPHLQTVIQECNHICSAPPLSPLTNSHVRMY